MEGDLGSGRADAGVRLKQAAGPDDHDDDDDDFGLSNDSF
jgi:hypothetical protein